MKITVWDENGVLCFRLENGSHLLTRSAWSKSCGATGYRLECKCGANHHCIEVGGCPQHQPQAITLDAIHSKLLFTVIEDARARGFGGHADISKLESLGFVGSVS